MNGTGSQRKRDLLKRRIIILRLNANGGKKPLVISKGVCVFRIIFYALTEKREAERGREKKINRCTRATKTHLVEFSCPSPDFEKNLSASFPNIPEHQKSLCQISKNCNRGN